MKKLLVIALLLLGSITLMAQHMNFLGKPLGCGISAFKQRMAEKGFKCNGEVEPAVYTFDGTFGGDRVLFAAYVTPKTRFVYGVGVFYQDYISYSYDDSSQSAQMNKFESLVSSFKKKYGENCYEGNKLVYWEQEFGDIAINIPEEDGISKNLVVWYYDKLSKDKRDEERESDY